MAHGLISMQAMGTSGATRASEGGEIVRTESARSLWEMKDRLSAVFHSGKILQYVTQALTSGNGGL